MKLSQLKGRIQEVKILVPGDPETGEVDEVVKVHFRPGALDLASLEMFDSRTSDLSTIRMFLEPILVDWDLQKDDGSPLGVTGEDLGTVPVDFLTQVLEEVTNAARPNPLNGVPSLDGSPLTENSDSPQNGTSSSEQQGTWA